MSRSRKHTPVTKIGRGKWGKQRANRSVRLKDLPSGKSNLYKRFYGQYNVVDYRLYIIDKDGETAEKCRRK